MNVQLKTAPRAEQSTRLRIVDCDVHPMTKSAGDLRKYLAPDWHAHFDSYGVRVRQPFVSGDIYPRAAPYLSRRDAYPPGGGPPGSDLDFMRAQLLDAHDIEIGILQVLGGGTNERHPEFAGAMCSAANDWQIAEWIDPEPRLRGTIAIPQDHAEQAVAEIRKRGRDRRFAQVGFMQRSMEPMGARRYWPIYAAAVEQGLPIGVHTGGYNGHPPVPGGGWPSFYAEQHHAIFTAQQALVASLVMEGVFEQFPDLRILLIEGGFTWAPALGWRLDNLWSRLKSEVPHVKRPPSEYIRKHIWFSTQPVDPMGGPEHLRQVCEWVGFDRLCFATDYPHWDFDDPRHAFPFVLSESEKAKVFAGNARALYRIG